jgi:hypothetical protein
MKRAGKTASHHSKGALSQTGLLMVLVGLTLAHLGYRFWERRTPADAVDVSTMMVGDPLPDLLIEVADGTDSAPEALLRPGVDCQLIVVFDPTCPHCRLAAQREAEGTSKARLPTTWVTDAGGPRLDAYRGLIHPDSRLGWAPEIYDQLRIQGVPAAFLVDSGGSLRQVWAYNGGREDHGELSVKCEGGLGPSEPAASVD